MADGTTAPKGALIAGLVLMLLAFGGCGFGCVSGAGFLGDVSDSIEAANSTPLNTPTTLSATGAGAVILTSDSSAICLASDPTGKDVEIKDPGAGTSGSVEVNGQTLDVAYGFETDAGTTYDVICGDEAGALTGSYAVAPIPGLGRLGNAAAGVGAGVLFFLLGLVLVIVGLVRRSKWKKLQGGSMAPPQGGVSAPPPPGATMPQPSAPAAPPMPGAAPPMPGAAPPMPGASPPMPAGPPPAQPPAPPAQPPAAPPAQPPAPPAQPPSPPAPGSTPPPPPGPT